MRKVALLAALASLALVACVFAPALRYGTPVPDAAAIDLHSDLSRAGVAARSEGCVRCHVGQTDPHPQAGDPDRAGRFADRIGCTDCHGGNAQATTIEEAHVLPRNRDVFRSSANPERSYTALLDEPWEFVRFVNPGDLRVAALSCGTTGCHAQDVRHVERSMMTHGAMLWGAALYNNGSLPSKTPLFGESYDAHGRPRALRSIPAPSEEARRERGVLPALEPLPRFEVGQPSNILRIFERGQKAPLAIGLPAPGAPGGTLEEEPGRPANRLSARGLGTLNRVDPVWLNLQRTRLLDPTLNMLGTNDQPGDFRSSGCTACHVVYANDRDFLTEMRQGKGSPANHSASWARHGNAGTSAQGDPTIPSATAGHPIRHLLTRRIPSSQCIVCHMHPGTAVSNTYLGYTWWDLETDGRRLWPKEQVRPGAAERTAALARSPEGSTPKGSWRDPALLARTGTPGFNATLEQMQLGDFHGHGFLFRAVWKRDLEGRLLDASGARVRDDDPERWKKAVHLKDIHLEKGMHCVDCHFKTDSHGDGNLYGELRAATAIECRDCHGTITAATDLRTSGNAGPEDLAASTTPFGKRFRWRGPPGRPGSKLIQRSTVTAGLEWSVPQIRDTIDPRVNPDYASDPKYERARLAKTLRRDGTSWGDAAAPARDLAHRDDAMECYACHTSWTASCFGCHLPMRANERRPMLHNEGTIQRNWTSYSFQTLRDDVFLLGKDGALTGGKVAPIRSACAVMVGSQNQNREWVYSQQQTVSAEGYSGTAFSPHFPHTVRATETRGCTDCHVSAAGDNNARMAQVLMQGTNAYNFIGRYCYVAEGAAGLSAVVVTEREEPQAVIGSRLHEMAYPEDATAHEARGRVLEESHRHGANVLAGVAVPFGSAVVRSLQLRGEYLYAACGSGGLRVFDVAEIDHKGFSERITSAPVSPLGQRLHVPSRDATCVRAPSTQAVDPARMRDPANREQPIHPLYAYLYVTDREEGLILVNAATLLDGDPTNNFLERAVTFDGGGALRGAVSCAVAGEHVYVCCERGLVVVSVADPLKPRIVGEVRAPGVSRPRAVEVQFRYAFVASDAGLQVVDVTDPARPRLVREATVPLADARSLYVVRTTAYVAAGRDGLAVVDVERPERPRLLALWTGDGELEDARDVKCGMTNASLFAYVADGRAGLKVLQLTSPEDTRSYAFGWKLLPRPRLIARFPTRGPALAISEGIDRDRAVDESGHQTAVFGRLGSRPLTGDEMRRMYMKDGRLRTVTDAPPGPPVTLPALAAARPAPAPRTPAPPAPAAERPTPTVTAPVRPPESASGTTDAASVEAALTGSSWPPLIAPEPPATVPPRRGGPPRPPRIPPERFRTPLAPSGLPGAGQAPPAAQRPATGPGEASATAPPATGPTAGEAGAPAASVVTPTAAEGVSATAAPATDTAAAAPATPTAAPEGPTEPARPRDTGPRLPPRPPDRRGGE
jgi:hypothetical protein